MNSGFSDFTESRASSIHSTRQCHFRLALLAIDIVPPPPERTRPAWAPITTVSLATADALGSILAPLNRSRSRV